MKIDTEKIVERMLKSLSEIDSIHSEDIPNIQLYMDQVTTLMDEQLGNSRRYQEDKILTKTMINNYAKNNLLPPPEKKKYTKQHVIVLVFIYYLKNILSIKDIDTLLTPLTEKYFYGNSTMDLTAIYDEIFSQADDRLQVVASDIKKAHDLAKNSFLDVPEKEQEYLQLFTLLCILSLDVYLKKQLIEKVIDTLPVPDHSKKKKGKESKI